MGGLTNSCCCKRVEPGNLKRAVTFIHVWAIWSINKQEQGDVEKELERLCECSLSAVDDGRLSLNNSTGHEKSSYSGRLSVFEALTLCRLEIE